ncbi:hypothetical protein FNV43_RR01532 [Rhamnella rubrinervis]|uniref:Uncharacterized protein n=1 Tax=Rhamnella rubrinervis TaxID=2594499 RepID=A0A8K0MT27_9ROSA|nr:hypothetical protein FNV43_RR01532 [Rhamnella rubrinervis]
MESSLSSHEAQKESDNLIQQHDHQIDITEEETKEKIKEFMEYDVYEAAENGEINPAFEQRKDRLHSLLTPQKNTILHIHLTSNLGFWICTQTNTDPEPDEFVETILGFLNLSIKFETIVDRLQCLLAPQKNTILHIYLTSKTSTNPKPKVKQELAVRVPGFSPKTSKDPEPEIDEFVEAILGFCPPLLMSIHKEATPLHIAARYGLASIVKQLIKHAKEYHPHGHRIQDNHSHGAEAAKKIWTLQA